MKILITGSTGLIGSTLISLLKNEGHEILRLVRARSNLKPNEIAWDLSRGIMTPEALEGVEGVVHLAGENIAEGRWTQEKKKKILDSRVQGTHILSETLASLKNPPKVLVSASAIGYYGDRGNEILTEQSSSGHAFVSEVCRQWEQAAQPAVNKGIRVVHPRIGVVLSPKGGALAQLLTPFKTGLGGKVGDGTQYMSWIAIDDVVQIISFLLQNDSIKGPVNTVSPNPVTNEEFTKKLGHVLGRPTFMTMPAFAARLAFGELADELFLASMRVKPAVLEQAGYQFNYPTLLEALQALLGKGMEAPAS